jgi:hypothetical protein
VYEDKQHTTPKDMTDYDAFCVIKEGLDAELLAVVEPVVSWTDQANGIGQVFVSHADSLKFRVHTYVFEIKVFDNSSSGVEELQKTIVQAYLDVTEVLKTTGLT